MCCKQTLNMYNQIRYASTKTTMNNPSTNPIPLRGQFTTREAEAHGLSRMALSRMVRSGRIVRLVRGVYEASDHVPEHPFPELETLLKQGVPFVATLLTALRLHGFTSQLPPQIWIAIPPGRRTPSEGGVPVECVRVAEPAFSWGVVRKDCQGLAIPLYSPEKTVADCFKFRNKIGLDVALEALHDGWRKRLFTVDGLMAAARVDRVSRVIHPYVEGMLVP